MKRLALLLLLAGCGERPLGEAVPPPCPLVVYGFSCVDSGLTCPGGAAHVSYCHVRATSGPEWTMCAEACP